MPLLSPALRSRPVPEWLDRLDFGAPSDLAAQPLPLFELLRISAYYPAGGFHGFPMKWLGGAVHSFVYADYGVGIEAARDAARTPGLEGYRVIGSADISEAQLTPNGWTPGLPVVRRGQITRAMQDKLTPDMVKPPFALWTVFERCAEQADDHGPRRISILYVGGDGVATYDALYRGNACAPQVLCLIRPGTNCGFNYTDFYAEDGPMAEVVLGTAAQALPCYLVSDRVGPEGTCCWPQHYPQALPYTPNRLGIRIWGRP